MFIYKFAATEFFPKKEKNIISFLFLDFSL